MTGSKPDSYENVWRKKKLGLQKLTTSKQLFCQRREFGTCGQTSMLDFLHNLYESIPKGVKQVIKTKEHNKLSLSF